MTEAAWIGRQVVSLYFFRLGDRLGSAGDRTPYRQQILGTSCLSFVVTLGVGCPQEIKA
jgi:hypothetical protein